MSGTRKIIAILLAAAMIVTLVALSLIILKADTAPLLLRLTGHNETNRIATYQAITLALVALMLVVTRGLIPGDFRRYFRFGDLSAPSRPVRLLGIQEGDSWKRVGTTFAVIITLVTAGVVYAGEVRGTPVSLRLATVLSTLVFAASNTFVEEMVTRFQVVAALTGMLSPSHIALTSGLLFGLPHYVGTPGGIPGVLLAGFLGWLLAKSVVETEGMGWAWLIHFLQDVVIYLALLSTI